MIAELSGTDEYGEQTYVIGREARSTGGMTILKNGMIADGLGARLRFDKLSGTNPHRPNRPHAH